MLAIYRRELKSYFTSVIACLFIAVTTLIAGIFFVYYNLSYGVSEMYSVYQCLLILVFTVPILTMKVIADERRQKTDQLILTAPVSVGKIVVGKFFALETIYAVPVFVMCLYPLILSSFGTVSFKTSYTNIFGLFLYGTAFIAIGIFISSITESQVISAILSIVVIDNMREEHQERLIKNAEKMAEQQKADEPRKKYGFVAVSVGEGLDEIFKGLNVDHIISGGQTMNPSTEDILNAIDKINADNIYVLPNNKNIILAAQQAESLVEDKNIIVIPSKTIPQGISAMIGFIPDNSPEDNKEAMIDSMSYVKTGEVTYAVRDTVIDDKEIKEGNIMGIGDEGILAVGEEIDDTTINMIKEMQDEESEIVSLYYGVEVTEEAANKLADKIAEALPEIEVEVYPGGQPIYYYIASVE